MRRSSLKSAVRATVAVMHPRRVARNRWTATPTGRVSVLGLTVLLTLLCVDAARANSLTGGASPAAQPVGTIIVSVEGTADLPATLRVFVQEGGTSCVSGGSGAANAEAQAAITGSNELITREPFGPFAYSASFLHFGPGSLVVCAYLFDTSPLTEDKQLTLLMHFDPPPPPPADERPATDQPTPPADAGVAPAAARCVVPALKGRTLLGARKLIRRAGCSVGTVVRPGLRTTRRARAQGRLLRVVSQTPAPRSVVKAKARVRMRLAYVTPRHRH